MTYMLAQIEVGDYEQWKDMFDGARGTVRREAKGHRILRNAEDPNHVFIQVEFPSADDARAAREELKASGAFGRVTLKSGPTIVEEAEAIAY
jgi:hypothetical protein